MSRAYEMNQEAAARVGNSNFITESGRYAGKFVSAIAVKSKQGTDGVEFSFKSDDDRTANYLQLWTYNAEGRQVYGFSVLSAIMQCLRVSKIAPRPMTINDGGGPRSVEGFPELVGKPIGLLLQREDYVKQDGTPGFQLKIIVPFDPRNQLTAAELIKGVSTPAELAKQEARLSDKPAARQQPQQTQRRPATTGSGSDSWDAMQDDVPWR